MKFARKSIVLPDGGAQSRPMRPSPAKRPLKRLSGSISSSSADEYEPEREQ
jgi:hypothetical protein